MRVLILGHREVLVTLFDGETGVPTIAPGRRDDGELTLFRSLGLAVEDLAAAELAVKVAKERGIGTEVEL
jgi:Ornithine cyclodeaminase/mu-crystallin family